MAYAVADLLMDRVRALPPDRQREVLDFVEFLHQRETPRPVEPSLRGVFAHLGVHLTEEDFDEVRQEMMEKEERVAAVYRDEAYLGLVSLEDIAEALLVVGFRNRQEERRKAVMAG